MMKAVKYILILFFALASAGVSAQSAKKQLRRGNKAFEQNRFSDAEVRYKKALDKKPDYVKGKFNLGDAYYREKNYKDADSLFTEVAATAKSSDVKAKAWYNKGNSLLSQKKYAESIEAYKNALRLNPDDSAAKYNLEYARKKLKKQQQQQKQQKNKNNKNNKNKQNKNKQQQNKNKDKNKNDKNKKDKQNKNKEQNKKEQQQNKNKQQQQNQNKEKEKGKKGDNRQQKQQPKPQQISKQDAKRMLDALKNGEKKTLQKLQLQKAKAAHRKTKEIDW